MTTITITVISDLHGHTPTLPPSDLLLIAGDLVGESNEENYDDFRSWVAKQPYKKIIITPGNHDTLLEDDPQAWLFKDRDVELLINDHTTYQGLTIYATPWTRKFPGQNPLCCAYTTLTDMQLVERFSYIPQDTDILISHSPPLAIMSQTYCYTEGGSLALRDVTDKLPNLKLHVFGHIHEGRGISMRYNATSPHLCVNAAYVNRDYIPYKQSPVTLTLQY